MKIKLVKALHRGQSDMVCLTEFGTFSAEVGEVVEVEDKMATAALAKWPGCFKEASVEDSKPKRKKEKVKDPEVDLEKAAEAEANKMAAGYENKKV